MSSSRYPHRKGTTPDPKKGTKPASKHRGGIFAMRVAHNNSSDTGTPLKTTVLVDGDCVTPARQPGLQASLESAFAKVASHRPAADVVAQSVVGSPLVVQTPGGTQLPRTLRLGSVSFFSNHGGGGAAGATAVDADEIDPAFFDSDEYKAVKYIREVYKLREHVVIESELQQTRDAYKKSGFKRGSSQNRVMAASASTTRKAGATGYARATNLFSSNVRWEWLHLVAYVIAGPASQNDDNMVAGMAHANTDMMLIEMEMAYLASEYPGGFKLEIMADLIEGTQVATKITYLIKTDDFTLPFEFDAQHQQKPHAVFRDYMHHFLCEFVAAKKAAPQPQAASQTSGMMFVNKVAPMDQQEDGDKENQPGNQPR